MEGRATMEPDTVEVLPQHRFDVASLETYLHRHLPGFGAEPGASLTIVQYRCGQSNPTFYLQKGHRAYVLRKKPLGPLLPRAHKV